MCKVILEISPEHQETLHLLADLYARPAPPPLAADDDDDATVVRPPRPKMLDVTRLPPSPLFSSLDKYAFEAVVQQLDMRWMKKGEVLLEEGRQGDSMFVVVQGSTDIPGCTR